MNATLLAYMAAGLVVNFIGNVVIVDRSVFRNGKPTKNLRNRYQILDLGTPDHKLLGFATNLNTAEAAMITHVNKKVVLRLAA